MSGCILSEKEKRILLALARKTIEDFTRGKPLQSLDVDQYPEELRKDGATFVTLMTDEGELRGCIGALEAYQPLVLDVQDHALAAARDDFRFQPVEEAEVEHIKIDISCLTSPEVVEYEKPDELPKKLHPGLDGVILSDGFRRATFLPQVWEKVPDAADFLSYLCEKMGVSSRLWQHKRLQVFTYRVISFCEKEGNPS